jgi:Flp pilus assembly pilin Flp
MKLLNLFKAFKSDESGAVTVDWVVLTAAIVGLGLIVISSVSTGVTGLADQISAGVGTGTSPYTAPAP